MCASFGYFDNVIVNWDTKKHKKTAMFDLKMYKFAYNSKTTRCTRLKFGHNVGAYECFMKTEFGGARSSDQNFTGRKAAKKWRISTDLSR